MCDALTVLSVAQGYQTTHAPSASLSSPSGSALPTVKSVTTRSISVSPTSTTDAISGANTGTTDAISGVVSTGSVSGVSVTVSSTSHSSGK